MESNLILPKNVVAYFEETILIVCGIHASINFVKLTGHTIQNGSIFDTVLLAVDLMNQLLPVFMYIHCFTLPL